MANSKKVIFLDIDGVLNTTGDKDLYYNTFDISKLKRVIKLNNQFNSNIVIISDRRVYEEERNMISKAFSDFGSEVYFLSYCRTKRKRSDEILEYLDNKTLEQFVILDDNDLGYSQNKLLASNFVNTEENGFDESKYAETTKILMM